MNKEIGMSDISFPLEFKVEWLEKTERQSFYASIYISGKVHAFAKL